MKKEKKNVPQAPVNMTQDEMNDIKRGNSEILAMIHKRILKASPSKKERAAKRKQSSSASPSKVTAEQLKSIKKTGKLPSALRNQIEREKYNPTLTTTVKYKHPEHREPDLPLPQKYDQTIRSETD